MSYSKRKRHIVFNLFLILIPWLSTLFIGKRYINRYFGSSFVIGIYEIISHIHGRKQKYWKFYDKPKSFMRDELPFDVGPYIPMSMWILKYSYGNFKKYVLYNVLANGVFAFIIMPLLKNIKIIKLDRLNHFQFFIYIHYKAYLLYGVQYLFEKIKEG